MYEWRLDFQKASNKVINTHITAMRERKATAEQVQDWVDAASDADSGSGWWEDPKVSLVIPFLWRVQAH